MVCSMMKKGVLATALGAGALFLAFGTSAPSYVKTAFHRVRQTAKDSVDPRFEIERARNEIASLQPAFDQNKEVLARSEVDAERLQKEIGIVQARLDRQKGEVVALQAQVKKGDYRLTGHVVGTADEAKARLAHRFDQYKATQALLAQKQELLKSKQMMIDAAHTQLETLKTEKHRLLTELDEIEAKLALLEASRSQSEFNFDSSALARAREAVTGLEERLDVMSHKADIDEKYGDIDAPTVGGVDPRRDVVKEVDEAFGPSAPSRSGEKSL